jgi:hypothetical protein
MKKIFFAFVLTFFASIPSFAQDLMMQATNNMLLMAAMDDNHPQQQAQVQVQAQAPIVIQIQYQPDGTPVVTSSSPIQVQTVAPTIQAAPSQPEDNKTGEIFLALFLGLFVGSIITKMFSRSAVK